MTTLELGPAHVGGLSWGGVVALELYRRHREAVGTLILTGTYAGWKGSLPPDEVAARVAAFERSIEDQSQSVAGFFPGLFATDPLPPRIAELMAAMDEGVRRPTLEALIPAVAAADFSEMLPLIDVPTLLIWGEADVRSPVLTVGHQFRNAIPGAHMVVLEGAGHMSQMEAPEAFNRAVREFCSLHGLEPDTSGTSR
jgi:pimeloyl-ACP methyl ester carboxylesterase